MGVARCRDELDDVSFAESTPGGPADQDHHDDRRRDDSRDMVELNDVQLSPAAPAATAAGASAEEAHLSHMVTYARSGGSMAA